MKSQNLFVIRLFLFTLALAWPFTAKAEADQLWLHDGYWVAKVNSPGFGPRIEVINDMHVNSEMVDFETNPANPEISITRAIVSRVFPSHNITVVVLSWVIPTQIE